MKKQFFLVLCCLWSLMAYSQPATLDDYFYIKSECGKYLTAQSSIGNAGSPVVLNEFNGTLAQKWKFVLDEGTDHIFYITSATTGNRVLDVIWGKDADGTRVQLWNKMNAKAQKWYLGNEHGAGVEGKYTIQTLVNVPGDASKFKNLDKGGGPCNDGTPVMIWTKNTTSAQKWYFEKVKPAVVAGANVQPDLLNANAFSAVMAGQRLTVFKRNSNGALTHKFWDGQAWSNWVDLGLGAISSAPSAVMANGRLVVFARTMHGTLTHKYYDNQAGAWSDWVHLGAGEISSAPSAVFADGRLVVFARTMHNTLTHKFYDNGAGKWSDWVHLGTGEISSAPSAVVANGRLVVFARTMHGTLTHKFYDAGAGNWTDWIHLGTGEISSSPAAVVTANNRLTVFARTMHGTLTHKFYDAGAGNWTDWGHLGTGELSSMPSAVVAGDRLTVFARTMHGTLTHKFFDNSTGKWTDWVHLE